MCMITLTLRNTKTVLLSPVDEREVIYVVNGCKHKTSTDYDAIGYRLIKSVITYFVKPITHILNYLSKQESFLKKMKIVKVIPLFNPGGKVTSITIFPCSHNSLKS